MGVSGVAVRVCERCEAPLVRNPKHSRKQWEGLRFCGRSCASKSIERAKAIGPCDDCGKTVHLVKGRCRSCYMKARWRDPDLREENVETRRRWREEHPDYWKQERIRIASRRRVAEYAAAHPEEERARKAEQKRRRRAQTCGAGPEVAAAIEMLRGDPCSYCGGEADTVDHIEPLIRGGAHVAENLTAACRSCNGRKWATPLLLFLFSR